MSYEQKRKALAGMASKAKRVKESAGFDKGSDSKTDKIVNWLKNKLSSDGFSSKFNKNRKKNPNFKK